MISVTMANMVVADFDAFNNEAGLFRFLEGVGAIVTSGQQPDGTISLDIHNERISVVRSPNGHTMIKRDFPDLPDDLDRLAQVAQLVFANTETTSESHTFGFNVEAACTQSLEEHSSDYLSEHFFDLRKLADDGMRDFGASSWELEFSEDDRTWRMNVRSLQNVLRRPNLFVTLNSHHAEQRLPDRETIAARLGETWEGIPEFVSKLERTA